METPTIDDINSNLKRYCSPKYIKNKYPEFYKYLKEKYPASKKITEAMWLFYHNIDKPVCKVCGGDVKFINWNDGFTTYCCRRCMSIGTRDKAIKTHMEKYGGIGTASKVIRDKIMNKCNDLYGGCGFGSDIINDKIKNTNKSLYGDECPMHTEEIKNKLNDTFKEKYGVIRALQVPEFLKKSQNTCVNHYGVKHPSQNTDIKKKQIDKIIEKYGGIGFASHEIRMKSIETNLNRYNREYGFDYDKVKVTNIKKYGVENPLIYKCSTGQIKYKGYSKISQIFFKELDKYLKNYTTTFAEKGGEKLFRINNKNYYVDYFIEELNTAIEFNGDLWHANPKIYNPDDRCFPKNKNITAQNIWDMDKIKIESLNSIGLKVVTIWESDYRNMIDIKSWIVNNLNIVID